MVSELIEHESWNFLFLQKIWALWFYVHLLHTRLWLEGHAKEILESHGDLCNIVCYSVLLLDADSASSEKNAHSGMLFSSNTETVVQNSSTIMCSALLYSTVLTRDWLLQNFQQNCFHDILVLPEVLCMNFIPLNTVQKFTGVTWTQQPARND